MKNSTFEDAVNAGSKTLATYAPVSPEVEKNLKSLKLSRSADMEEVVRFRMNQTGNIYYATTSEKLEQETKALFDSVTVLFAAMTRAMGNKGKTLFDYDTWAQLIRRSGFFVEVQRFEKQLSIKSGSLTIDTQIIQQLIPGLTSGSSLEIAKSVLSAMNGEFSMQKEDEKAKVGHLLFICEELFGAPSVTVRLFFASKESHKTVTASPCHKSSSTSFEQLQQANTFLFVDPDKISKYSEKFASKPEAYEKLVSELESYV